MEYNRGLERPELHEVDPGKYGRFNADNLSEESDWQGSDCDDKNESGFKESKNEKNRQR